MIDTAASANVSCILLSIDSFVGVALQADSRMNTLSTPTAEICKIPYNCQKYFNIFTFVSIFSQWLLRSIFPVCFFLSAPLLLLLLLLFSFRAIHFIVIPLDESIQNVVEECLQQRSHLALTLISSLAHSLNQPKVGNFRAWRACFFLFFFREKVKKREAAAACTGGTLEERRELFHKRRRGEKSNTTSRTLLSAHSVILKRGRGSTTNFLPSISS